MASDEHDEEEYENEFIDVDGEDLSPMQYMPGSRSLSRGQGNFFGLIFINEPITNPNSMYPSQDGSSQSLPGLLASLFSETCDQPDCPCHQLNRKSSVSQKAKVSSSILGLENSSVSDQETVVDGDFKGQGQAEKGHKVKGEKESKENDSNIDAHHRCGHDHVSGTHENHVTQNENRDESSNIPKELSVHDDKPIAKMLHKTYDKSDDMIIKGIWSTEESKCRSNEQESQPGSKILTEGRRSIKPKWTSNAQKSNINQNAFVVGKSNLAGKDAGSISVKFQNSVSDNPVEDCNHGNRNPHHVASKPLETTQKRKFGDSLKSNSKTHNNPLPISHNHDAEIRKKPNEECKENPKKTTSPDKSSSSTSSKGMSNYNYTQSEEYKEDFNFGSKHGFNNYGSMNDGCHGYSSMGSTKSSSPGKYGKSSYGFEGITNAFDKMQKMMAGMNSFAEDSGFQICDVSKDGNCMFAAVVDQLYLCGDFRYTTTSLRHAAVRYLTNNPHHEDGSHLASFLDHESWEEYLYRMDQDTEWGDHLILTAVLEVAERVITVYNVSATNRSDTTLRPSRMTSDQSEILYLGHYGEEHYVSLRPKNWETTWYKKAVGNQVNEMPVNSNPSANRDSKMNSEIDILENMAAVDPVSGVPLPHLSFIIKILIDSKCICTSANNMRFQPGDTRRSRVEVTGSAIEGLSYQLQDYSYYTRCSCVENPYKSSGHYRSCCDDPSHAEWYANQSSESRAVKQQRYSLAIYVYLTYKVGFLEDVSLDPCHVAIVTKSTHPGYVNLQMLTSIFDPSTVKLVENRPMLKHIPVRVNHGGTSEHVVSGLDCKDILPLVTEWIWRKRQWPSDNIIQDIIQKGCLLIARAHPSSADPEIEWQILFSEAEKILATKALSQDQKYCFSVFKVLVDCHTRELDVKLSTNHLKYVFFYACEVIPSSCWSENTGGILLYLFQRLLGSIKEHQLPHYFIRENNTIDHFSREATQLLEDRLEAMRRFPIISMQFIAQRHSILLTSVLDDVIDDMKKYRSNGDLADTFRNVFAPTILKVTKQSGHQSYNAIASAYAELSKFLKYKSSRNMPDFHEFLKKSLLSEKSEMRKFTSAFYMDVTLKTNYLDSLFEGQETKSFQEILGIGPLEKYQNVKIPVILLPDTASILRFLDEMAYRLYLCQEFEESAYLLRCGIAKVKSDLKEDFSNVTDEEIKREIVQQNYTRVQILNVSLNTLLIHLFTCYANMNQPELFLEYMDEMEEVADRMGQRYIYSFVAGLWESFGSAERAAEARRKMQMAT